MVSFKKVAASLSAIAFAGVASAGTIGPDGLDTAPACSAKTTLLKVIKDNDNDIPTGIKGYSKDWKMEILADPQDGSWTVVGESLKPGAQPGIVCPLRSDIMGFPADVVKESFYQKYFANVATNKALVEKFMKDVAQGTHPTIVAAKGPATLKP